MTQDHLKKERLTSWMKNIKKWVVDQDFCIVLLLKLGVSQLRVTKSTFGGWKWLLHKTVWALYFELSPPLCSDSLFRHKRLLVQQSSRVKKVCSTAYVFKCNACTFFSSILMWSVRKGKKAHYRLPKNTKGQLYICETPAALPKGRMWSLENRMGWTW